MQTRRTKGRRARHPITSRAGWTWPRAARAGVTALLVAAAVVFAHSVDVAERLRGAQAWMDGLGAWGPIAFIGIYVATTLAAGPGLPFTLVAPVLFGPWPGVLIMVAASSLSASAGFLVARYLARGAVERHLEGNEPFARVIRLLDEHAWVIIPCVRVVPVPFALNNYGFGLTSISFWRYFLLSEVGMVPMNVALVLGAGSALGVGSGPLVAVAVVAGAGVALLAWAGHRAWRRSASPRP